MKKLKLLFFSLLLIAGCAHEDLTPEPDTVKLHSEEYFIHDSDSGTTGWVELYKKLYHYDQGKLVRIDIYDFNLNTHEYDSGYKYEEYQYTSDGKLSQKVQFIGSLGLKRIKEYEYLNATSTKVTRYRANNANVKILEDWWIMERTTSSLTVKYYQGDNELYAQLNYTIDDSGNTTNLSGNPSFPLGEIHYEHDNSPNPYKFQELSGEYGIDSEKYLSENNVLTVTNNSNKSIRIIEYNDEGYPISIATSTSKRILTYQ